MKQENQTKEAQPDIPIAGHSEKSDQWFKIGLSSLEVQALKMAQERVWGPPRTPGGPCADVKAATDMTAATMRILIVGALAHFDALLPHLMNDADYMRREGFTSISAYLDGIIKRRGLDEMSASV